MTINVNGSNATGIQVNGGQVIGTQNNTSYHYGYAYPWFLGLRRVR
jgi:hypothetical protein